MKSLIKNNLELIECDLRSENKKENDDSIETYFSALTNVIPVANEEEKRKIYQYIYASLKKKKLDLNKIDIINKIGILLLELEFSGISTSAITKDIFPSYLEVFKSLKDDKIKINSIEDFRLFFNLYCSCGDKEKNRTNTIVYKKLKHKFKISMEDSLCRNFLTKEFNSRKLDSKNNKDKFLELYRPVSFLANDLKTSEKTLDVVLNIMSSVVKTQDEAILFLNLIKKYPEKSTKLNNHSIYSLAIAE